MSSNPGQGIGGRKNPSRTIYEANIEESAQFGKKIRKKSLWVCFKDTIERAFLQFFLLDFHLLPGHISKRVDKVWELELPTCFRKGL